MSLSVGQPTSRQDIINLFTANVTNRIMSGISFPVFSKTAPVGIQGAGMSQYGPGQHPIPAVDTKSESIKRAEINSISMPSAGQPLKASALYNALVSTMSKMGAVRAFTSKWYHQTDGTFGLVQEFSGKASFQDHLNVRPNPYGATSGQYSYGWTRSTTTGTQNLSRPGNNFGGRPNPTKIVNLVNSIYNSWSAVSNNRIVYTHYTCHSNCHSSCHGNRSRR